MGYQGELSKSFIERIAAGAIVKVISSTESLFPFASTVRLPSRVYFYFALLKLKVVFESLKSQQ